MMATESLRGRSDEATLTSEPEPAITIEPPSQNASSDVPQVNGDATSPTTADELENKHIAEIVDDLVNSTEVSVSGGSDNEAAKGDASKLKEGDKGHGRTSSSVKKSFKAISVNKTFLTTKSATPSVAAKPTDKLAPASGAPSSASAAATSRPRLVVKSGSGLVAKSSSGANGGKTGSAPDPSAVWNKNRPAPPPQPKNYTDEELKKYGIHMASRLQTDESKAGQANWADIDDDDDDWAPETITWQDGTKIAIPHVDEPAQAPEPEPAPKPAPAPAPVAAHAPKLITKENGIPEKPKTPASMASPIVKPGVLGSGKGLVLKGAPEKPTLVAKPPAPPTPVKSPWAPIPKVDKVSPIAAEIPTHGMVKPPAREVPITKSNTPPPHPKEIAADDFSRSAWRDGSSGAGRELFNSHSGRYEPVPDRRNSLRPEPQHGRQPALLQRPHDHQSPMDPTSFQGRPTDQPYGRRRGSSNVSGGSGVMHRLKTQEQMPMPPAEIINRRGSMTGRSDSPASPNYSPGPRHGQAWPPRASPATSHATPYSQHAQPIPPVAQQPVPAVIEDELELQKRVMRERRELAMKRRLEEEAREEAARKERIRLKLEALGPAPESNKAKKAVAKDQPTGAPTQIQSREAAPASHEAQPSDGAGTVAPAATEVVKADAANGIPAHTPTSPESAESRQPHPTHVWPPAPKQPERNPAASWGAQPIQPIPAKNVWGAPNNNRSLGNGTFNADLVTPQVSLPTKTGPGPIAPPSRAPQAGPSVEPNARLPPIGPPKPAGAGRLSAQERAASHSHWASQVRLRDADFNQLLNEDFEKRDQQLRNEGRTVHDVQPIIKDTWRPTKLNDMGHRDETAPKRSIQLGPEGSWNAGAEAKLPPAQPVPSVESPRGQTSVPLRDTNTAATAILGPGGSGPQPSRGSRFFPSPRERHDTGSEFAHRPKSPSPPPPDMAGHPAFDGDVTHPHVSLPPQKPVVRLPPSIPTQPRAASLKVPQGPASTSQAPSFTWASQAAYVQEVSPVAAAAAPSPGHATGTWQEKIDSLLGGRRHHQGPRSPVAESAGIAIPDASVTTKVQAEECFEEQEMGSLPQIRIPTDVPEKAYQPFPPPKPLPKRYYPTPLSAEAITFPPDVSGSGHVWRVALPGREPALVTLPFSRARSNPRRGGGQRGGRQPPTGPHHRGDHRGGGKGRDGSSSYANDGPSSSGPSHAPNRGRGGYRGGGRGEGWGRSSQAIQT